MNEVILCRYKTYQSRNRHVLIQETLSIAISFENKEVSILMNFTTNASAQIKNIKVTSISLNSNYNLKNIAPKSICIG
jgi:hypothetical protein